MSRATLAARPMAVTATTSVQAVGPVTVTPGTSNATGAWTEMSAATPAAAQFVVLHWANTKYANSATNSVLLDIGIGAAGAEVAIASSILVGGSGGSSFAVSGVHLPLYVPGGSRLAVRLTTDHATGGNALIWAHLLDRSDRLPVSPPALVTMGAVTASSKGTTIASNDTYVQVAAATATPYQALVVTSAEYDAIMAAGNHVVTFAVGASGTESVIAVTPAIVSANEETGTGSARTAIGGHVPAGTRIAAKCSDGATNAVSVTVLGVPYA